EGAFEELEDLHVYGSDWESFSLYEKWKSRFNAEVRGPVATQLYEESLCSPCVGYERNRSGKAYMIAAAGCVPLLYGDGSDVPTWDREGLVIPLGHPTRI